MPPAGAPGLRLIMSTHFFSLVPSTATVNQVGTLPLPCRISGRAEGRAFSPMFQIERVKDDEGSFIGQHRDHHPFVLRLVPEDIRIAEVGRVEVSHRIAGVIRPGSSTVIAEGDMLLLPVFLVGSGVDGDQTGMVLSDSGFSQSPLLLFQSTDRAAVLNKPCKLARLFAQGDRQDSASAPGPLLTACPQLMCPHRRCLRGCIG